MEILAGLIKLDNENTIPAPWYNRPALGLRSNMKVNVATVARAADAIDGSRVPPDIIVSPLDPSYFETTYSITIDLNEGPGQIGTATDLISKYFNIELMETVTINHRQKHRICFVINPREDQFEAFLTNPKSFISTKIKRALSRKNIGEISRENRFEDPLIRHKDCQEKVIEDGQINISALMKKIREQNSDIAQAYDFNRVVVSSNTQSRFIRYIFPRTDAFQLTFRHADKPGAMANISRVLSARGFNILLSRVSKNRLETGKQLQTSETFVICESSSSEAKPAPSMAELRVRQDQVLADLALVDNAIIAEPGKGVKDCFNFGPPPRASISRGRNAKSVLNIFDTTRVSRVITAPEIRAQQLPSPYDGKHPAVFLAMPTSAAKTIGPNKVGRELIKKVCKRKKITVLDGYARMTGSLSTIQLEKIYSRMWRADAFLFIADFQEWLKTDQLIEWGFAHAMGLPKRILTNPAANAFLPEKPFMLDHRETEIHAPLGLHDDNEASFEKLIAELIDDWFPGR